MKSHKIRDFCVDFVTFVLFAWFIVYMILEWALSC